MEIFELTKKFPDEEKYSLTSQIRRSSRSVYANIAEAYRKRMYEAHFVSKVTDADMENSETSVWIDTAYACKYVDKATRDRVSLQVEEIGRMLNHMIEYPEKYLRNIDKKERIEL